VKDTAEGKMKKIVLIALSLVCIIILTSCDVYAGKRPTDYKETKWVSENPNIYIEISDKYYGAIGCNSYGVINMGLPQIRGDVI
jgi:hypothetical protein